MLGLMAILVGDETERRGGPSGAAEPGTELLLIEDDPAQARLLAEVLHGREPRWTVTAVRDGAVALAYLRRGAALPALVLLDVKLPRMMGHEVLAAIRADATWRHLPVVMLSSSDAPEDVRRAHELGALRYLVKPRTLPELVNTAQTIHDLWLKVTAPECNEKQMPDD